jgi:hypothetical protein
MTQKPDQKALEMRTKVFRQMLETRGWKYRAFLKYLKIFKYAAFAPARGEFLESYYALMRYIDDVVDGDVSLPENYQNVTEYITDKIGFSMNPVNPKDQIDYLLNYCFELAEKFDADFHEETKDILNSLLFDAKRRGKSMIFSKEELNYHFHLLDIRGTIRATLKIFNDNPDKYKILEPLGIACRHQYDIEDFEADIAAGYVNISKEDFENFEIKKEDIYNRTAPNVRKWLQHHAREGMDLIAEHHRKMPKGEFSILEKLVFRFVYEIPAKKVFRKVLSE